MCVCRNLCSYWSTKALIIARVQRGDTQHGSLLSTLIMTVCVSEALSPWRPIKGLLTHYLEALSREDIYCPLDKGTGDKKLLSCPEQHTHTREKFVLFFKMVKMIPLMQISCTLAMTSCLAHSIFTFFKCLNLVSFLDFILCLYLET